MILIFQASAVAPFRRRLADLRRDFHRVKHHLCSRSKRCHWEYQGQGQVPGSGGSPFYGDLRQDTQRENLHPRGWTCELLRECQGSGGWSGELNREGRSQGNAPYLLPRPGGNAQYLHQDLDERKAHLRCQTIGHDRNHQEEDWRKGRNSSSDPETELPRTTAWRRTTDLRLQHRLLRRYQAALWTSWAWKEMKASSETICAVFIFSHLIHSDIYFYFRSFKLH